MKIICVRITRGIMDVYFLDHQTLGGFPKVKEGSSRGFDGK